jgi:hypothetical protein
MYALRTQLFRALVMVTLISSSIYLTSWKDSPPSVYIVRNVAWNDFIAQIAPVPYESPQVSLGKEMLIIQNFLKSHETEVRVGIYDVEVFKAIDQARARLQKADRDLETLRNELSYKEKQAKLGGDRWNSGQASSVANVSSRLSREKDSVSFVSRFPARRATTSSTEDLVAKTVGKLT